MLVARLVKGLGPALKGISILLVLARTRNLKFETLAMEDLVEVESGGGGIEPDPLSGCYFIVGSTSLALPSTIRVACVAKARYLVFNTQSLLVFENHLPVCGLGHYLLARVGVTCE
jgi:hypothetical protein